MKDKLTLNLFWSDEDKGYIVTCDQYPFVSAWGPDIKTALHEAGIVFQIVIEKEDEQKD